MIYEYYGIKYCGTRAEILIQLRKNIDSWSVKWIADCYWTLGSETSNDDCTPSEAKEILTKRILDRVPKKEYWFDGKTFNTLEDIRIYLYRFPLKYSNGYFLICDRFYSIKEKIEVRDIKKHLIERIINELKLLWIRDY